MGWSFWDLNLNWSVQEKDTGKRGQLRNHETDGSLETGRSCGDMDKLGSGRRRLCRWQRRQCQWPCNTKDAITSTYSRRR
jgi:hypothetical protein